MTKIRAVLRRRWGVLLLGLLLGALAGAVSTAMAPEAGKTTYKVSQVVVANRASAQQGNVGQDALRVTRGTVAKEAAAALGEGDALGLASKISAVADPESGSIEISSTDEDPDVALERVGAFADAFLQVVNADLLADQQRRFQELQQQIDQATQALDEFDASHPGLGPSSGSGTGVDPVLVDQRATLAAEVSSAEEQLRQERLDAKATLPYSSLGADAPTKVDSDLLPVPTSTLFRAGLLGLFGLLLGIGLAMVVERLNPRIDTRDELVSMVDFPVLAEVGLVARRQIPHEFDQSLRLEGIWAEPYRRIRSAIQFVQASSPDHPPKVFLFTSPSPGEGKSTTTAVTALAMAETGQRTLVIGGDFRRPSVHELLGAPAQPGIREHAQLDIERPTAADIVHPTGHAELYLAPAGAPGKEVVGLADAARALAREAAEEGAVVLIDTSPVEAANDTIDLLPVVDEVIIVVRSGRTARKTLAHTIEVLRQHGASIMGAALIATPGLGRRQYYYEGYYGGTAEPSSRGDGKMPTLPPDMPLWNATTPAAPDPAASPPPVDQVGGRNGASPSGAFRPGQGTSGT